MRSKIIKIITVMLLLVSLTMINFIYVGVGFVSLAAEEISTNHKNIDYSVELKSENLLTIAINVKNEGYFNGEITLENSNFKLKNSTNNSSEYVNKIEENKILLNQINAGTTANVDIEIEPVKNDDFDAGLLNSVSKLKLTGTYKDSTEKDIQIDSTREVELKYSENNNEEKVENSIELITNKVVKFKNEEKRIIQLSINMGLKENNYPIKEITTKLNLPEELEEPEVITKTNFNTMTGFDYNVENSEVNMKFTNEPNEENKILWKKSGCENVILTLVYNKDINLDTTKLSTEENVKLYNNKEIKVENAVEITSEEKDSLVQISNTSSEEKIYKGKINASIDRTFETKTKISVNLANSEEKLTINEETSYYNLIDENTSLANVVFNKTSISKQAFDNILGENGKIIVTDENGGILGTITSETTADENGNIAIDYEGKEPSSIKIETTAPVKEGDLEFTHVETIKQENSDTIKNAIELVSKATIDYSTGTTANSEAKIGLEESKTEADLSIDKDTLSTIISNDVEIRATLKSNDEKYNLYENPRITFELPEPVENITVNSIDLLYETEMTVSNYEVNGRTIIVDLTGKQTSYKDMSIEGAMLVINANIVVNRKAATQDGIVLMTVTNKEETINSQKDIKIVAPTDMTLIHSITDLGIETIGQEESVVTPLDRGTDAKDLQTQIEIINNNENTMENVKVLGTFPTRNSKNNIDTAVVEGLNLQGIEGAKVYYTENENATEDLQNTENGWQENISDNTKVKKYLIEIPTLKTGASVLATYKTNVPAKLEYNQEASQDYKVNYQNSLTKTTSEAKATEINMETGVGPVLETKLTASVSGTEQNSGTIKNGEVIKYKIEVSNVGSEDISNVVVKGLVPEGTTLVEPQDNFEYTGSSYYKELENKTFEDTIANLPVGEVVTKEYEVRVNNDTASGTNLVNKSSITYGDVTKESSEVSLSTENANIRATVKRVTDRSVDLYEAGAIQYLAIIENISNETQNNVKVRTNLPSSLEVSRLNLITNMESQEVTDEELQGANTGDGTTVGEPVEVTEDELTSNNSSSSTSELIDYQDEIDIGSLEPGQNKVLSYDLKINKLEDTQNIEFSVKANAGEDEYRSNVVKDEVRKVDISLSMTAEPDGNYVKTGDTIKYTIKIKNNGTQDINDLILKDEIPNSLTVNKVTFDGEEVTDLKGRNSIELRANISAGTESTVEIETVVNYSEGRTEAEAITNVAHAEVLAETVATTPEITHIIEAHENHSGNTEKPDEEGGNSDVANGKGIITGIAWFDENANGQKDAGEELISGVKVKLFNTETNSFVKNGNGSTLEVETNENGVYVLDHIQNGKYIVIFDYENSAYGLTKYKAEGVSETNNSDAIMKELNIDGKTQEVASTDILTMEEGNISDVNVGYIKLQNFDIKLEKFVTKIVIQDSSGSTVKQYNDETLARAELDAKRVNGATVLIEYKIRVSNVGEASGYIRKIVDYKPNDLTFNSELNKDWYQTADGLYNESLANDEIKAGETREVTLTLTKDMTENNVGLINNTAEIEESYNELGLQDSNSTPGNRANGENDMGSADVLLGIRTGGAVYIGGTIGIVGILGVIAFVIIKKKRKNKEEI